MSDTHELKIYPFSYTRAASDEECQRKRYLGREWGNTGLMPVKAGWPLVHGNIVHKALEDLAKLGSVDVALYRKQTFDEALKAGMGMVMAQDWGALVEGQLRGFQRVVWPNLMAEYTIQDTERWITMDIPVGDRNYKFRARQDLLLKSKHDGHLCYIDYKNTSSTKPQWVKSWSKSIQLHSSMYALEKSEGIKIDRALVIGLYKGYNNDKKGQQQSVFTYGYANREYAMTPTYQVEYTRARGWEQFSVADEFDDLSEWVAKMNIQTLGEQFLLTQPIHPRYDIAEVWFRQQLHREAEVADAVQVLHSSTDVNEITDILDKHFKQNFSHCDPAYGYSCEFQNLCWIPWIGADPVGSGQFRRYESDIAEVE